MTQDEIAEMYQKANGWNPSAYSITMAELEAFAKLVAAKEREACIAIAESKRHAPNFRLTSMPPQNGTAVDISNAIRARGETNE